MGLESIIVVPDTHERFHLIDKAGVIVDSVRADSNSCSKVIQVGDWYNEFDYELFQKVAAEVESESMKNPDFQRAIQQQQVYHQILRSHIQKEYSGNIEAFQEALTQGKVPAQIAGMHREAARLSQQIQNYITGEAFEETIRRQLDGFNEPIKNLKAKDLDIISVYGNHDPKDLANFLPDVRFIEEENEGIIGHSVSFPPVGLPHPSMHAPSGLQEGDDDVLYGGFPDEAFEKHPGRLFEDLEECRNASSWYQRNKEENFNFVVCHNGPKVGLYSQPPLARIDAPSGGGLTALAEDRAKTKESVTYLCGHHHDGAIYLWKNQLVINPGMDHIAEVIHEDGDVKAILLYEAENPEKGAVEVFLQSDIQNARFARDGVVWCPLLEEYLLD